MLGMAGVLASLDFSLSTTRKKAEEEPDEARTPPSSKRGPTAIGIQFDRERFGREVPLLAKAADNRNQII